MTSKDALSSKELFFLLALFAFCIGMLGHLYHRIDHSQSHITTERIHALGSFQKSDKESR